MSTVTLTRRIAASPAIVFAAVTTAEGIGTWWRLDDGPVLVAESNPRVGGAWRVRFRTRDGNDHEVEGRYLVLEPPRLVRMTFRWTLGGEGNEPSEVIYLIEQDGERSCLTLTHTALEDDAIRESHEDGWRRALDHLAAAIEATT